MCGAAQSTWHIAFLVGLGATMEAIGRSDPADGLKGGEEPTDRKGMFTKGTKRPGNGDGGGGGGGGVDTWRLVVARVVVVVVVARVSSRSARRPRRRSAHAAAGLRRLVAFRDDVAARRRRKDGALSSCGVMRSVERWREREVEWRERVRRSGSGSDTNDTRGGERAGALGPGPA